VGYVVFGHSLQFADLVNPNALYKLLLFFFVAADDFSIGEVFVTTSQNFKKR
jgi:hypothetical protein